MVSHQLSKPKLDTAVDQLGGPFSSTRWLTYFQQNKAARIAINFPEELSLPVEMRQPLLRSLQRFQIGETGEGKHLRKYASRKSDPVYEKCIDLFVKEEQFHATVLAQMIGSLNGTLLSWHWTDLVFVLLRRTLGLKTEVFILLIAEIIGKCFYRACADQVQNKLLSDAFSLIVLDELGHLEFHCSFLRAETERFPQPLRFGIYCAWSFLFYAACFVFIADHRKTLTALNVPPRKFLNGCSTTFTRSAAIALTL